jgi:acetamidase/formamidase
MTQHYLAATPETVQFGVFKADIPPVLEVGSDDTVTVECLSGNEAAMPPPSLGVTVPPALPAVLAAKQTWLGPHILTGPIAVRGAEPGDMLEIRIDAIELGADWGFNLVRPLAGTLPEDFHEAVLTHIVVDKAAGVCRLPWGTELKMAPFFGVMGVAPVPAHGALSSKEPRQHGGNLDNKELVAGSTLFLPVWVSGGCFSVGDGHGVQGDGEVCVTALEMCLTGTFTFVLHKGGTRSPALRFPRAETPTHYISMGLHEDLDQAMKMRCGR